MTCARRKSRNVLIINYLNIFHFSHVFTCDMIQSHKSGRRSRTRTAGEGGLSLVFASRAAVPHPAPICVIQHHQYRVGIGLLQNKTVQGERTTPHELQRLPFCNPPPLINPLAGPYKAYPLPRWKGKVSTSNYERPFRGFRCRLR